MLTLFGQILNESGYLTNYSNIYNILADEIKNGYIIHGSNEDFDIFDPSKIKGGFRAKEGYGFYFSDSPYKPMEYGNKFKKVKKEDFNFINAHDRINLEMFKNPFIAEYDKFEALQNSCRNIREYDMCAIGMEKAKANIDKYGDIFDIVSKTIKQHNLTQIGSIEYYIENPPHNVPKLINLYRYYGFDGYHSDNVYTIFNFEKLNMLVEDVNIPDYVNEKKESNPYKNIVTPVKKVRQGIIQYEGGVMEEREPDFEIGFEGDSAFNGYGHVTNGSAGISEAAENLSEEVNPEDINLTSFNIKKKLNPIFWENKNLNKQIRLKLLDIADEFIGELNISDLKINDIILTGSLANYNWSKKYSDIDLHILIDFEKTDINPEIVKPYFDLNRKIWNMEHKSLRIFGYPIEIYVQDINEPHKSSGIYSLMKDKWLVKPNYESLMNNNRNDDLIKKKVAKYINIIDDAQDLYNKLSNNTAKLNKLLDILNQLYIVIKNERKFSLINHKGSEMSDGNIIFKALRRSNYIEKLIKLKEKIKNSVNSLRNN